MSKEKTTAVLSEAPPVKPWCYRVGRTGAKKFGARENWPRERGEPRPHERRSKRVKPRDLQIDELLLIAQCKAGGLDGRIARAKLRAMNKARHVTADEMRREITERLTRLAQRREVRARDNGDGS